MDDIGKLITVLILGIPIWLILAVLYVFIRLLHNWLTKKGYRLASITLILAFTILLAYSVYTPVYPSDGFYLSEFKDITLREAPKSAEVIRKDASYPFFRESIVLRR
jgi:glucan phosphoethanolaminetransferase (alkaline phosphatase superfamily)